MSAKEIRRWSERRFPTLGLREVTATSEHWPPVSAGFRRRLDSAARPR